VAEHRARAFTLIELLVVITIILLLVMILAPAVGRAIEVTRRGTCMTNIKEIVRGCRVYAMDAKNHRGATPKSLPNTKPSTASWFAPQGNRACLWLLVKYEYLSPAAFICPSLEDDFRPANTSDDEFADYTFGYSFQSMVERTVTLDSFQVVVADMNPRFRPFTVGLVPGSDQANSNSHLSVDYKPEGQNVGWLDESVKFLPVPKVSTGRNKDDWIYQSSSPGSDAEGKSRGEDDVMLVN